jgi:site-specific recombinase XerC
VLDAGGAVDEAQELLGHAHVGSTQIYLHQPSGIASGGRVSAGWQ